MRAPWIIVLALAASASGCGSSVTSTTGGLSEGVGGGASSSTAAGTGGSVAGTGGSTTGTGGSTTGTGGAGGSMTASGTGGAIEEPYPPPPYGFEKGDVIPDIGLQGYPHPDVAQTLVTLSLATFYNPSGSAQYPGGSPFAPGPKPKALVVNVSAKWSGPDNFQQEMVFPVVYPDIHPQGVELLSVLYDAASPGQAATEPTLHAWALQYTPAHPIAIDPTHAAFNALIAFPTLYLVDTETMTIIDIMLGSPAPDSAFWDEAKQVAGP